ncbi:PREDICTED: LOW QUALITY PROTEIN: probable tubulin polyglutamylase TTLL2 [Odobenus rosmarus divergens]|uniref:LOW QUALITY PROTEIN: probable tubulin polyglutamylase TTLL2 n=1 Tax=Odobenus rosmarus divergens TaxID=9708 RepID=A0A2U3W0W6_ODORO|nr:PREDICTED: LOW QUALITY PROTEIN: probable tubulin polyglutamylase TTLL2 [Odobenus rosmarus divergens]
MLACSPRKGGDSPGDPAPQPPLRSADTQTPRALDRTGRRQPRQAPAGAPRARCVDSVAVASCRHSGPAGWLLRKRKPYFMAEDKPPGPILKPLVFRVDDSTPEVVQSVLLERGWGKFDKGEQNVEDWNLYWRTSSFRMTEHINIKPWQHLNHYPGTTKLTRKDHLAKHLKHMKKMYGTPLYEFIPLTFIMPKDDYKFVAEYFREKHVLGAKHSYRICKPAKLSHGRGIIIFSDIEDLIFDDTYVVQKYICNPLLVGRYKCDLRIYVCVTGFKPLTIYIYQEGLVRFATEKFDLSNLQKNYAHLTNSSINKSGVSYEKIKEVIGHGCKWTLSRFFSYLRSWDVDDLLLWQKINHMVILTVLAIAPSVPFAANCFELFGFDILINENLKPWLLEVNFSPALSVDCSADVSVKRRLIHDTTELIYLQGLRNERTESRDCVKGSRSVSLAKLHAGRLNKACSALSCESLLQLTGKTFKDESAMKKAKKIRPENKHASQTREMTSRKKDLFLSTKEPPKTKPKLKGRHSTHKTLIPFMSLIQSCVGKTSISPCVPSDNSKVPDLQAGNFVLIFPFNEATFGASRNGLNVQRIIQELQKLMNKQHPHLVEKEAKRRFRINTWVVGSLHTCETMHIAVVQVCIPAVQVCVPEVQVCIPKVQVCVPEVQLCIPEVQVCIPKIQVWVPEV